MLLLQIKAWQKLHTILLQQELSQPVPSNASELLESSNHEPRTQEVISLNTEICCFGSKKRSAYTLEIEGNGLLLAQGNPICFSGSEGRKGRRIT